MSACIACLKTRLKVKEDAQISFMTRTCQQRDDLFFNLVDLRSFYLETVS